MNMKKLSLVLYACCCLSACNGFDRSNAASACGIGTVSAKAISMKITQNVIDHTDMYSVEVVVPDEWEDMKFSVIQLSGPDQELSLDVLLADHEEIDSEGRKYHLATLIAEKKWLQGDFCIRANFAKDLHSPLGHQEAIVPLKL